MLSAAMLLLIAGCGGESATITVSGTISVQEKPVSGGLINFQPTEGQPLGGGIGLDGTYEYQLPPGEYKVRIDTPPQMPEDAKDGDSLSDLGPRQVPEKYGRFQTSGLTATIKPDESTQQVNFNLQ